MRSALLALALCAPPRAAAQAADEVTDLDLRAAWAASSPAERREIADWFAGEVQNLDTAQLAFLGHARQVLDVDPGLLPRAQAETFFDPVAHAPAQPVPRRWLEPGDAAAVQARAKFLGEAAARPRAFQYSWGRRQVERSGDASDPELVFENALAGRPPGVDLAEAVVLAKLDDGSLTVAQRAFEHAYTDRSGRAYPGLSLYDAWASGLEMEMPDIDNLGIVHDVLGEWKKWVAPVPAGSKQRKLYETVGELFQDVHRQRGLAEALAGTYAMGSPPLRDGYSASLDALHWLWESAGGEPVKLAPEMPEPDDWKAFLADAAKTAGKSANAERAALRRATLDADARTVRAELVRVMREAGALRAEPAPRLRGPR